MSTRTAEKIFDLEVSILQKLNGNGMNAEDARKFYSTLTSYYEEYTKAECDLLKDYPDHPTELKREALHFWIDLAECVQKKIIDLQNKLKGVFLAPESTSSIDAEVNHRNNENDPSTTPVNLNTLLRKQKFYVEMINSLASECELSSEKAELRYEHVSNFYKDFISNQKEIVALVGDDAFDDHINISKEVQEKVLSLQGTLKEIFSPNKMMTTLPESKVNEHINSIDRRNDTVDVLDSHYKKQRSLIKQIELIESKNNLSAADAERLLNHLTQLHDSFIQNQAKIETYVNGSALDKELKISYEIDEKVISLQINLNKIIAPIMFPSTQSKPFKSLIPIKLPSVKSSPVKPSSAESNRIHKSKEISKPDNVADLNSLFERQKSLIDEIKSMKSYENIFQAYQPSVQLRNLQACGYASHKNHVELWLSSLFNSKKWFISNQTKIEKRVNDCDLHKQKKISERVLTKLKKLQIEYEFYYGLFAYLDLLNNKVSSSYDSHRVVYFTF